MLDWIKVVVILILLFSLFLMFGSLFSQILMKEKRPLGETIIVGFYAYYVIFQLAAVPMTLTFRKLSELSGIWCGVVGLIACVFLFMRRKHYRDNEVQWLDMKGWRQSTAVEKFWQMVPYLVAIANIVLVSVIYSNYYDATFYVGGVSFNVHYDTIGTVNPLTGRLLDELDFKHCLATYHVNDSIICQLFEIHPLIQTKTIMVIVITVLLNIVYYQMTGLFFDENARARGVMMGFMLLINLCTYTAYTSSSFILLRTYEGKAITAAVTGTMLLYCFIKRLQTIEKYQDWMLLIIAWGAVAISPSAIFVVSAGLGIMAIVHMILDKKIKTGIWYVVCMIPAIVMLGCYLLNHLKILSVAVPR